MARRRRVAAPPPPPPPPEPLPNPEPTTDPDEALARLRQAEAMLAAAERRTAAVHAKADAMKAAADAEVDAAKEALQRVRAAALTAAREARRGGRALAQATHASALPADVIVLIASLLPRRDLFSMMRVCSGWLQALAQSPSPLFRSIDISIEKLMSGPTQLPACTAIKEHAADIVSLRVRGCVLRREFACVASLVPSLTRLTHLALAHEVGPSWRPEWTQQAFRGAAGLTSLRSASFCVDGFRGNSSRPVTGAVFSGLGAALARVTALSYDSYSVDRFHVEVGREDQDWLQPATALRTLDWKATSLPRLPASLTGLRELKLIEVSTLPPADATPALANVESVTLGYHNSDAMADALFGRLASATRLVVNESYRFGGVAMPASLASARSLRRLTWETTGDSVAPAASLPALTWLRLVTSGYGDGITVEAGRTSFPALRTLVVAKKMAGRCPALPALGPDFAPRLSTLVLINLKLDLAAVARWHASALKVLQLKKVTLTVDSRRVDDAADAALADARAVAAAATEEWTSARAASEAARQRLYQLPGAVSHPAGVRPDVDEARAAVDEAKAAADRLTTAKIEADRRVNECAAAVVARNLPAALPAVTRVAWTGRRLYDLHAKLAVEALRALGRRPGQAAAGGGGGAGGRRVQATAGGGGGGGGGRGG